MRTMTVRCTLVMPITEDQVPPAGWTRGKTVAWFHVPDGEAYDVPVPADSYDVIGPQVAVTPPL